jgi:hypothetical protein
MDRGNFKAPAGMAAQRPAAPVDTYQLKVRLDELERLLGILTAKLAAYEEVIMLNGDNIDICVQNQLRIHARTVIVEGNQGVQLTSTYQVHVNAPMVVVDASATMTCNTSSWRASSGAATFDTGMMKFSGLVKCDTIQANSVIGASYTPGAGNVW